MTHVVPLGADDQARVRMASAAESAAYDLDEAEPVLEVSRWNGTTEIYPTRATVFSFVSGDREPDRAARLATVQKIIDDLREALADGRPILTEEQLVVRYGVSRATLRRALAELRARGLLEC